MYFEAPINGNDPDTESGKIKKRIINVPEFRKPIRENRCIIPADYFILIQNVQAWLFFHTNRQPFSLAGIYDYWKKTIDNSLYEGSAILTFPAFRIFKELGFSFIPMLIDDKKYKYWLRDSNHLTEVTSMMNYFQEEKINGYQVDFEKIKSHLNERSITIPQSKYIQPFKKESNSLIDYLRKNKYRKGGIHTQSEQEQRLWKNGI